jgi:hypothetical protein
MNKYKNNSSFHILVYLLMINFDRSRRDCEGGFLLVANRFTTQNGKITAKSCVTFLNLRKKFFDYGKVKDI